MAQILNLPEQTTVAPQYSLLTRRELVTSAETKSAQ